MSGCGLNTLGFLKLTAHHVINTRINPPASKILDMGGSPSWYKIRYQRSGERVDSKLTKHITEMMTGGYEEEKATNYRVAFPLGLQNKSIYHWMDYEDEPHSELVPRLLLLLVAD